MRKLKGAAIQVDSIFSTSELALKSGLNEVGSMNKVIPFPKTMDEAPRPRRKRSMTSIALSWLSERMSKADEIKQRIDSGTYRIPKDKVAQVLAHPGVDEDDTRVATMASTDRA